MPIQPEPVRHLVQVGIKDPDLIGIGDRGAEEEVPGGIGHGVHILLASGAETGDQRPNRWDRRCEVHQAHAINAADGPTHQLAVRLISEHPESQDVDPLRCHAQLSDASTRDSMPDAVVSSSHQHHTAMLRVAQAGPHDVRVHAFGGRRTAMATIPAAFGIAFPYELPPLVVDAQHR